MNNDCLEVMDKLILDGISKKTDLHTLGGVGIDFGEWIKKITNKECNYSHF